MYIIRRRKLEIFKQLIKRRKVRACTLRVQRADFITLLNSIKAKVSGDISFPNLIIGPFWNLFFFCCKKRSRGAYAYVTRYIWNTVSGQVFTMNIITLCELQRSLSTLRLYCINLEWRGLRGKIGGIQMRDARIFEVVCVCRLSVASNTQYVEARFK